MLLLFLSTPFEKRRRRTKERKEEKQESRGVNCDPCIGVSMTRDVKSASLIFDVETPIMTVKLV